MKAQPLKLGCLRSNPEHPPPPNHHWPSDCAKYFSFSLLLATSARRLVRNVSGIFLPITSRALATVSTGPRDTVTWTPGRGQNDRPVFPCGSRRKKRAVVMMVTVVALFAVCWAPFHVVHMMNEFGERLCGPEGPHAWAANGRRVTGVCFLLLDNEMPTWHAVPAREGPPVSMWQAVRHGCDQAVPDYGRQRSSATPLPGPLSFSPFSSRAFFT